MDRRYSSPNDAPLTITDPKTAGDMVTTILATPIVWNTKSLSSKELAAYLGQTLAAPSFHRQDMTNRLKPDAPANLPPYMQMVNKLHHAVRHSLVKRLNIKLDTDALKPETQELIKSLQTEMDEYRAGITEIQRRTGDVALFPQIREGTERTSECTKRAEVICKALENSELNSSAADVTIPLIVGGEHVRVSNGNGMGLAVLSLNMASVNMFDAERVPAPVKAMMIRKISKGSMIAEELKRVFSASSITSNRYAEAYASLLPDMLDAIKTGERPLQVLALMKRADSPFYNVAEGAENLLKIAKLPPLPQKLDDAEYAIVLHDFFQSHLSGPHEAGMALRSGSNGNAEERRHAVGALAVLHPPASALNFERELFDKKTALMREYLESPPGAFAARATQQATDQATQR